MALTQAETDVIVKRTINIATKQRDIAEEILRLESENITLDFDTNLLEPSVPGLTKAEIISFVTGPMFGFRDFWANKTVASDGVEESSDRRDKVNQLLIAEPLS